MNPTPYRAGHMAIGLTYRPRRSPQYAQGWEGHYPMKRATRTRIFRFLLRLCMAAVLFVFVAWTLLLVHGVRV